MSRPNISGRVLRARFAPFALGSLGALWLAAPSAGEVAAAANANANAAVTAAGDLAGGLGANGGIPSVADGIGPAPLLAAGEPFVAPRRVRLAFRRLHGELNVLDGHATTVAGALLPARAGRLVELQRHERHRWRTLARSYTGGRGRFRLRYTASGLHAQLLRVLFPGDYAADSTARRVGVLSVFRLAGASWYGGGGGLACGGWLTSSTLGVANKTLPCGTLVTLRYGWRSATVPVIDRGPYVAGREFDLTEATKDALGFEGTGEVWSSR